MFEKQDRLAFDRASVRSVDGDGHMHIEMTNISKACINPYNGSEIPDWERLGLDPGRVYQLLREPEELAKAAPSFDGKPLLFSHRPVTADDHNPDLVVGSISNPVFEAPYLKARLVIWTGEAIKAIESDAQKQISCGYRYEADMTPGTYDGQRYDGVMRNISGNHAALVKKGRAGPDVVIGDAANQSKELTNMTKPLTRKAAVAQGALVAYLAPRLAQDAKIDLLPVIASITAKNYKDRKAIILADLKRKVAGKLAQDADIEDVTKLLDALEDVIPVEAASAVEDMADPTDPAAMDDDEDLKTFLKSKGMSDEDIAKVCAMKSPPEAAADEPTEPAIPAKEPKDMVTKPAMDAAIAAAVKIATDTTNKNQAAIRDAERVVRPWVGDLAMSFDSAEAVYRATLKGLGIKVDDFHADALRPILEAQPKPGDKPLRTTSHLQLASDHASVKGFSERYPDAARIRAL